MFVLMAEPEVTWPVTVTWPADGGAQIEQRFEARLRLLTDAERDAIGQDGTLTDRQLILAFLGRVLVGWSGIVDPAGRQIGFDAAVRDRMLGYAPITAAVLAAYADAIGGKAAEGNFVAPPAPGRAAPAADVAATPAPAD